jgi:hypothetical protein
LKPSELSRRAELLRRCLSVGGVPAEAVRYPPAAWSAAADIAVRHGVGPLLFARLKRSDARQNVPEEAWKHLRLDYLVNAARYVRRQRWLAPLLRALHDAGIPVIVLKGAHLAEAVYPDPAVRTMSDVDLLVRPEDVPKAQTVLLNADNAVAASQPRVSETWLRTTPHLPGVVTPHLVVEVHWTLAPESGPAKLDVAGVWQRSRPFSLAGAGVLALSSEDLLLHLCLHISYQHRFDAGLRCFCDVAEVLRRFRSEIDWEQVAQRARDWRVSRFVGLTLDVGRNLLGADVPPAVLGRLVPGGIDRRVLDLASETVCSRLSDPGHVSRSVRDLWGKKSLGDRARLAWERVFLSRDDLADIYPKSRNAGNIHLYRLRRLGDVLKAHGRSVPRLVRSRAMRQGTAKMAAVTDWLESGEQ